MKRSLSRRGRVVAALVLLLAAAPGFDGPGARAAEAQDRALLAQQVEPQAGRVGHVRRNAQGQIELVAPPSAPAASAPAPAATPPATPPAATPPAAPARRAAPAAPLASPLASPPAASGPVAAPSPQAPPSAPPGATSTPAPRAAAGWAHERRCPDSVLLCLGVLGAEAAQENVPLTFGHPLAPKLLRPDDRLVATFGGAKLPVQLDQIATHSDGSVRFAIFSLVLPRLAAGGPHKLELDQDATTTLPAPPPIAPLPTDFRVEIETYAAPVYEVILGDRKTPFAVGERITVVVGEGATEERYAVTVTPEMAKPGFVGGMEIAKAFVASMAKSARYLGHRDALDVYDKFWITLRDRPGARFPVRFEYSGAGKLAAELLQEFEPRAKHVVRFDPKSRDAWLNGATAREIFDVPEVRSATDQRQHPLLTALLGIRQHAGSSAIRFEATIENMNALPGGIRNLEYDAVATADGKRLFEVKAVDHRKHSRWHEYAWKDRPGKATLLHDRTRLLDSRAFPAYDSDLLVSEAAIASTAADFRKSDAGPMGTALVTRAMPMTGGRADIGYLPKWSALHLISQDPRLLEVVTGNGDASGSMPVHYRDRAAHRTLNAAWYPDIRIYQGLTQGKTLIPEGRGATKIVIDAAHQPSLVYYPYLLTGERYYLDELHFWASFNGLLPPVDARGPDGLLHTDQLRGQAWALRTLAHAALATPDRHAMKKLLVHQLDANLSWYNKTYVTPAPAPGALTGWIKAYYPGTVGPWQQDFLILVVAHLAENDVPGARGFATWMSYFGIGRFQSEAQGYCRVNGAAYYVKVAEPPASKPVATWRELQALNFPDQKSCAGAPWIEKNAQCPYCYTSIARAALAALVNIGLKEAREPYDYIRQHTENRNANYALDPTFAIVPR